jgi:hypothetical protein
MEIDREDPWNEGVMGDDDLPDDHPYYEPKGEPIEVEHVKSVAHGNLGTAGCPKCGKPLSRRMTAMGPKWVCGC